MSIERDYQAIRATAITWGRRYATWSIIWVIGLVIASCTACAAIQIIPLIWNLFLY